MRSVTVCTVIRRPREAVFDHLDDLALHEAFTDHFLVDWSLTREDSVGVGAGARMRAKGGGRHPWITITVVDSIRPERTVEEGRGGKDGRRRTRGIYELAEEPGGATRVCFTNEFQPTGTLERLQAPLARVYLRRQNARALARAQVDPRAGAGARRPQRRQTGRSSKPRLMAVTHDQSWPRIAQSTPARRRPSLLTRRLPHQKLVPSSRRSPCRWRGAVAPAVPPVCLSCHSAAARGVRPVRLNRKGDHP